MWRRQGKRLVFVTNNSTKSRAGYLGKFTGLGLNVNAVRRVSCACVCVCVFCVRACVHVWTHTCDAACGCPPASVCCTVP
jgi:hypothetical protein